MRQYVEFIGKNIDKALEKASHELKIPVERLKYDVVSYGASGIFGLVGAKKAKIRVRQSDRQNREKKTRDQAIDLVKEAFEIEEQKTDKVKEPQKKEVAPSSMLADFELAKKIGKKALKRLVEFITNDARIDVDVEEQRLVFRVAGGNSALLIGKRGQTLEAIQYLVDKIVNRACEQRVRILVDVEGYLKTRKDKLQKMASRLAEKASKTRKPVTIGPMNAYDRRTVHLHLKSNGAVRTQSVGDGYYRKLLIFPKKRRRRGSANHPANKA